MRKMEFSFHKGHSFPEAKGLCVVIDVLRAFTTAAFAFHQGAQEIMFVSTPEEAFLKHQRDPSLLLMGEVEGRPIEGFHFGNSPYEIQNACLSGRRIVQRTSSGTQGVVGCKHASHILISSFVVANATIKRILELQPSHVSFIATGRRNGDEDMALAEYLHSQLTGKMIDLEHILQRVRTSPAAERIKNDTLSCRNGVHDLRLALQVNHFPFAVEVFQENGNLIGKAV